MERPIITVGCRTSHGGTVISGTLFSDIDGKAIARLGDSVSCPKCLGNIIICTGDMTMIVDGAPVARDGDRVSCGAILIADQVHAFVDNRPQSQSAVSSSSAQDTDNNLMTSASNSVGAAKDHPFDLQFQIKGETSGNPMANMPYRITLENGKEFTGITDADGLTQRVTDAESVIAKIEVPYDGNSTVQTDSNFGHDACHC